MAVDQVGMIGANVWCNTHTHVVTTLFQDGIVITEDSGVVYSLCDNTLYIKDSRDHIATLSENTLEFYMSYNDSLSFMMS